MLHVDLDQFIAAVEVLRRPELAGPPGGGRRPRRPDRARRGVHRVVRGPGVRRRAPACRCGWRPRKCPDAVFLPVDGAGVRRRLGGGDGHAPLAGVGRACRWCVEVLGWDEAFLAADRSPVEGGGESPAHRPPTRPRRPARLRRADPGRGARRDPAALLGRDRRQQAPGQDRDRLRQARAGTYADHRRDVVRGDGATGRPGRCGGSAARPRRSWRRSASTPSTSWPPPTPGCWPPSSGRRWGRGSTGSAAASTPARSTPRRGCRGRTAARRRSRRTSTTGPTSRRRSAR